jgi:hypothetical protein
MSTAKGVGRIVGVLLLAHMALGLIVPFVMLDRVRGAAGFLANAAGNPGQMRAAVLMLFAGSAVAIGIAIAALPVFRRYSTAMSFGLLALGVAAFTLQAVDNSHLLTLLSLSQEYATADALKAELLQAQAVVAGSARRWAHYSALLAVGCWIFLHYSLLFRFRLVPRALAGFGLIASLGQIGGVTLRGLLGYAPMTVLAVPLAPAYLALAVWLMVKGFDERHQPVAAEEC